MVSGYNDRFRYEVISAAVIGYERQCERADSGGTPLHRPWSYEREARTKKKLMTKTTWYRPADCVGFIPATPDSVLAKRIQAVVSQDAARLGLTVKIIETGGVSLAICYSISPAATDLCQGLGGDLLREHEHMCHHRHHLCPRVLLPGGHQLLPLPLQGLTIILLYQYLKLVFFYSFIRGSKYSVMQLLLLGRKPRRKKE